MKQISRLVKTAICMSILITILCMSGGHNVKAADHSPLSLMDDSVFPNSTLRSYLKKYDNDSDGFLSESEMLSITNLSDNGSFDRIDTFKGIEYLENLQTLVIDEYYNSWLDIDFSKNPKLQTVSISNARKQVLDLTGCPELTSFSWYSKSSGNECVEYLNVTGCTNLTSLGCTCESTGHLQKIEGINTCISLEALSLRNNDYSGSLDLSELKYLKYLTLNGNHISSINLKGCTSLMNASIEYDGDSLDLSDCISMVDLTIVSETLRNINFSESLSGVSGITTFALINTKSSTICYEPVNIALGNIDFSQLPQLNELTISGYDLGSLNLGNRPDLTTANFHNCKFDNLDVSGCPNLRELFLGSCKLDTVDVSNCPILCSALKNGSYNYSGNAISYYDGKGYIIYDKSIKIIYDEGVIEGETDPPEEISISNAKVVLSATSYTFDGRIHFPKIKTIGGAALVEGVDYTAKYSKANSWEAGTYTVTITGKGKYIGTTKAAYKINKAPNPLTVNKKDVKIKFKKVKKKARTFTIKTTKAQGKVTYKSNNNKVKVTAKGKVTVKKGTMKGKYKITVTAAGNRNYNKGVKTIVITVK